MVALPYHILILSLLLVFTVDTRHVPPFTHLCQYNVAKQMQPSELQGKP